MIAFMRGYLDGVAGCDLPLPPPAGSQTVTPPVTTPPTVVPVDELRPLESFLPATLDLPQGQSFRLDSEGMSSFDDLVTSLPDPVETRALLVQWGWQENVYRVYAADDPPANAVSWVAIGVHRFASADGAAAALPYFAAARQNALGYQRVDVGLFADQTAAMTGHAATGEELIIYARRGNLIFRADGIAPDGDPTDDVFEAMLILLRPLADEPGVVSPQFFDLLPDVTAVLPGLAAVEEHARSAATVATTFPDVAEAERFIQEWGWRERAARVFTGSSPSGTTRVETSVFRLASEQDAVAALPYFLAARAEALGLEETTPPPARSDGVRMIAGDIEGGREFSVYLRRGRELFRVTAIGPGDVMADLATILAAW